MGEVFYENKKKYNCYSNGIPYYRKTATINGKRHNFYGDGEKDCLNKIAIALEAEAQGFEFDKLTSKVGDVFKAWLFNIKRVDVKIKATTFARYEALYRLHIEPYPIAKSVLSKLNSTTLQNYLTDMYEVDHKTSSVIHSTLKLWRMFLDWAVNEGYIIRNPGSSAVVPGVKVHQEKEKIEYFTEDERKKIMDYMDSHAYEYDTLIKLAFATGMRQGELLSLKWSDIYDGAIHVKRSTAMVRHIDSEGNATRSREVWDTKTENAVRTIPLRPSIQSILNEHKRKQADYFKVISMSYVFTNMNGKLVEPANLRKSFERLLKAADVPYKRFHCIRHTFATEAIRRGVDVKEVQKLMGHSNLSTTYIYVQSDDASRRKAIDLIGDII